MPARRHLTPCSAQHKCCFLFSWQASARPPGLTRPVWLWFAGQAGFTLIEVLVVVSITALLVSLLIPSLKQARASAKLAVCQLQLRQWGMAFELYAFANKNFYPHTDGLDRDNGPADYFGWVDVLPPLMAEKPWREHARGHFPSRDTVFQCPAARLGPEKEYNYKPRRNGYFSYAMNSCLELDENCWRAPGDGGRPMPSFLKTDLIDQPGRVILLFDQLLDPRLGYNAKIRYRSTGKHCGSYPKAFSARHPRSGSKLGGSILFCDYHVEWARSVWKPDWPTDLEVPPRDDSDWFPYPP